jgi:phage terminase small subunit
MPIHARGESVASVDRAAQARLKAPDCLGEWITGGDVLGHAACLAFSDIRDLYDAEGRLIPIQHWPPQAAGAVASVGVSNRTLPGGGQITILKLRLCDKPKILELLCEHLGLLAERDRLSPQ